MILQHVLDSLQVVGGLIAAAALLLAYFQYRGQYLAALDDRITEISAVGLTYVVTRPNEGFGIFTYKFSIHNPGRLPISNIKVHLKFPAAVQRVHSDGTGQPYKSDEELVLDVAAVAAEGMYLWERHLRIDTSAANRLDRTTARIYFYTPDAGLCKTTWPQPAGRPSTKLQRRMSQDLRASESDFRTDVLTPQ